MNAAGWPPGSSLDYAVQKLSHPAGGLVNSQWGADRAIAMLDGMTRWLAAPASAGFRNLFMIRDLERLALIAGRADLAHAAASIRRGLPDSAFTSGVITNI